MASSQKVWSEKHGPGSVVKTTGDQSTVQFDWKGRKVVPSAELKRYSPPPRPQHPRRSVVRLGKFQNIGLYLILQETNA